MSAQITATREYLSVVFCRVKNDRGNCVDLSETEKKRKKKQTAVQQRCASQTALYERLCSISTVRQYKQSSRHTYTHTLPLTDATRHSRNAIQASY
mmetsp:Transcript_33831/g.67014  ORF Transcript_33831/g.67014 Transcript_33831/m.67014 type:complete len:96 (+) Transcript_33831:487-774(+)